MSAQIPTVGSRWRGKASGTTWVVTHTTEFAVTARCDEPEGVDQSGRIAEMQRENFRDWFEPLPSEVRS